MKNAIAYYRVSTEQQGRSGLGLDAQADAVRQFAERESYTIIDTFTETESGKQDERPELAAALARCKKERATLLIAKLDRLSRRVSFIAKLMDTSADFRVVEIPDASKFQLQIMAVFSEYERDQISQRTKVALAAAKQRGTVLGRYGRDVLSKENKAAADLFAQTMRPTIEKLRIDGFKTIRALSDELNQREIPSYRTGKKWCKSSVHNLLNRLQGTK